GRRKRAAEALNDGWAREVLYFGDIPLLPWAPGERAHHSPAPDFFGRNPGSAVILTPLAAMAWLAALRLPTDKGLKLPHCHQPPVKGIGEVLAGHAAEIEVHVHLDEGIQIVIQVDLAEAVLATPDVYLLQGHPRIHVIASGELDGLAHLAIAAPVEVDPELTAIGTGSYQWITAAIRTEHRAIPELLQHVGQY